MYLKPKPAQSYKKITLKKKNFGFLKLNIKPTLIRPKTLRKKSIRKSKFFLSCLHFFLKKKLFFNRKKLYFSRKQKIEDLINIKKIEKDFTFLKIKGKSEVFNSVKEYNKNMKNHFRIRKKNYILDWNKQKKKKVKQISLDVILYITGLYLQTELRKVFNFYYFVKFNQNLHRIISTEFLLAGEESKTSLENFNQYGKINLKKSIIRSAFIFYKYQNLSILSQIMKSLFERTRKRHRVLFEFFKTLIHKVSPKIMANVRLIVRGKINARPRARTATIGFTRFQEPNNISLHRYKRKVNYTAVQANAQTGSFFLKIISEMTLRNIK